MTDGMIERVARAIENGASFRCCDDRCRCVGDDKWVCLIGKTPTEIARDAIKEMREPTEDMQ